MSKNTLLTLPLASMAALALGACSPGSAPGAEEQPPLAGSTIGGPFTLTDSTGKSVSWSDFDGRYRIVYFGFTFCPSICPTDVQRMMQGFALFTKKAPQLAAQVQPIFITVDPERDTPAKVREFTQAFSNDLLGLTGSVAAIDAAADAFKIYHAKGEVQPDGSYMMDHSRGAYLMGRKGEPIALLPIDAGPKAVAAELAKWVH